MLHDGFPIALVERWVDHLGFNGGDFVLEVLELTPLATEFFFDGGFRFKVSNLGEVCETNARGEFHIARVLFLLADGVQQGGLARTVMAYNANAVTVVDLDIDVLKHVHGTKGAVDRFHVDEFPCHVRPPIKGRG